MTEASSSLSTSSHATAALHILLSPDGYYTYLQITKQPPTHNSLLSKDKSASATIDKTKIEKNYRRLSLKLHPDRPGGDAETFRVLERAKCVLMSDKLRKEYDLLGLDLEEEEHNDLGDQDDAGDGDEYAEKKADSGSSNPDSVMSHMASATVAGILQLAVRTAMMAFVSIFITKYKYSSIAAILFLLYTTFQINKARKNAGAAGLISLFDVISPTIIGIGLMIMYFGRYYPETAKITSESETSSDESSENQIFWSWTFWSGEALVMTMFALNTVTGKENSVLKPSLPLGFGFYVLCMLACLWLRGKTWRYVTVLGMEVGLALLAVLVFPVMEMILEEIMNEKLRKVGDKVRLYSKAMEQSYKIKLEENANAGSNNVKSNASVLQSKVELD